MIIELILGWLIGAFAAKNKKTAVLMGAIVGTIWGFVAMHIIQAFSGGGLDITFAVALVVAETAITILMAMVVVNAKMRKRARKAILARNPEWGQARNN